MLEGDSEYRKKVHAIIQSIINLDSEYVLDEKYIRWGRVERRLFALEKTARVK